MNAALELRARGYGYPFVTVERATGDVVGSTRYHAIEPAHRRLEIGYTFVARDRQRTVVNTEAKYLMMRHAFEALDMHRVEFKTDVLNGKSRSALLRIGAIEEGVLRGTQHHGRRAHPRHRLFLGARARVAGREASSRGEDQTGLNTPASMSSTSTRPSSMT